MNRCVHGVSFCRDGPLRLVLGICGPPVCAQGLSALDCSRPLSLLQV
jgi:hypothetical protein